MKSFWIFMATLLLVATFINAETIEERKGGKPGGGGRPRPPRPKPGGGGNHGGGPYNAGSIQYMNQFVIISMLGISLYLMK